MPQNTVCESECVHVMGKENDHVRCLFGLIRKLLPCSKRLGSKRFMKQITVQRDQDDTLTDEDIQSVRLLQTECTAKNDSFLPPFASLKLSQS